jgi:hypothetical protein
VAKRRRLTPDTPLFPHHSHAAENGSEGNGSSPAPAGARKPKQASLFADDDTSIEGRISHNHVHVRKSTFLAGMSARVHRWFRLTPSFGPDLVQKMLEDMETEKQHVILDPFSGAGTTLIEAKMEGHPSIGFEINPLLHFVCETSTRWDLSPSAVAATYTRIGGRFKSEQQRLARQGVEHIGIPLPVIHNVFRWWRPDVLKDMLILRDVIARESSEPAHRAFFNLALAGVLVPDLTNVTLGRLQLHFIDKSGYDIDVWKSYDTHTQAMIGDLAGIPEESRSVPCRILHADSTNNAITQVTEKIDRVITSPPYPNRYSYVWNTRPHIYLLEMFSTAKEASELDMATIGGTWGTATSCLIKGVIEPAYPVISDAIEPVAAEIRKTDNLMANYLIHYFNRLALQIVTMNGILRKKARCAYVVGCSRLKGVYVETDVLLGKVFEGLGLGFAVDRIERIRKRHSDKDLHESIVYVSR